MWSITAPAVWIDCRVIGGSNKRFARFNVSAGVSTILCTGEALALEDANGDGFEV